MQIIKNDDNSGLISENKFRELAGVHAPHCISIFIPTSRAGQEVDGGQLQQRYKNQLKEVENKCLERGIKRKETVKYLDALGSLLDDIHFWRNQSDGLAVFLHGDTMECYTLPLKFKEFSYLADHLYLLPVISLFNDNGKFYLLSLGLQKVALYEGTRHSITEIKVDDLTPDRLEEEVGYDYKERSLQHRGGQEGEGKAMFHGQGAGKDDKKPEIEKFFRAVDAGVMQVLNQEEAPLILACVEQYYPIYKEITSCNHLYDDFIRGNPDEASILMLHEKAWMTVEDHFKQNREDKVKQYMDLSAGKKTSFELAQIVPAAVDGRIDSLFIENDKDRFGYYDQNDRKIIMDEDRNYRISLYNLAAMHCLKNSGQVFMSDPEDMPSEGTEINALFRY